MVGPAALAVFEQPWYPGGSLGHQADFDVRPIVVKDCVRPTITGDARRQKWTDARNEALAFQLGLQVQQLQFSAQVLTCTGGNEQYPITQTPGHPLSDTIYLLRDENDDDHCGAFGACASFTVTSQSPLNGYGWVSIPWNTHWADQSAFSIRRMLTHEIGHTLGFGHGGTGTMQASYGNVNTEEENALLDYYQPSGGGPGCGSVFAPLC